MLVAIEQCDRVLVAGGMIIGRERHHVLEEKLGIVGNVEFHADLREQAHPFDVIAMGQQVLANDVLGGVDFAVREHAEGGEQFRRQCRELRGLTRGVLGIGAAPGHAEQHLECMPARGKRWVQIDGAQKRLDGRLRRTHGHIAMPSFLEQAAVTRMAPFQFGQRRERLWNALQIPQAHCGHVQHVAILGNLRAQHLGSRERLLQMPVLEQRADAPDFGFDRR